MKRLLLGVFTLACSVMYSQTFTSSNLPIVIINTDGGADIVDDPRVGATMKIIYRTDGLRNNVTDQDSTLLLNYNGRIDIEVRGSSSQFLPKKGYGLTTRKLDGSNNNVSLLGMPAENDWILNGLAYDSSLMRDFLSYELARRVGNYAPRTVYCELMINGAHYGLYLLQEKIKLNSNRVDIAKMEAADTSLPKLTGGYITKVDKPNADTPAWSWSSNTGINDVVFLHEYPKAEDIHEAQHNYIKGTFEQLATAAAAHNSSKINGYPSVIDIPSFVDFMIMNELSSNADGYHFSSYFHKERQGKLRAGPIWDFNLTFGNDLVRWLMDRSKTNVWQFDNGDNEGPKFWLDLFNDPTFRCYFARRWHELTQPGKPLYYTNIEMLIDQTAARIQESVAREKTLWGTVSVHAASVRKIKRFLTARMTWMNMNIGDFPNCATVKTPPLVISKIMYNPVVSQKEEFIEIMNNADSSITLTGMYLSNLGIGYQFPVGTILEAGKSLVLASDDSTYEAVYGTAPFDEYARNLSNGGQSLVLADAFGNEIDRVDFSDKSPWPNADGNGAFLELADPDLDNNIASNWRASQVLAVEDAASEAAFKVYPSPVKDILFLEGQQLNTLYVMDIQGKVLNRFVVDADSYRLDMSSYTSGLYLLKIESALHQELRKVIKE